MRAGAKVGPVPAAITDEGYFNEVHMQIAGVSTSQVAQVNAGSDPVRSAFAVGVQRQLLDQQEQVAQRLINAVPEPQEVARADQRVGGNIDLFA